MSATTRPVERLRPGRRRPSDGPAGDGPAAARVRAHQRERMLLALADTVAEKGYDAASVADVVSRAKVSRSTFYLQFTDKRDAFLAAFDLASERLAAQLLPCLSGSADPHRTDELIAVYLDALLADVNLSRVFLVDIHAAGPEAIARRAASQDRVAEAVAGVVGATNERARFACRAFVAAASTMASVCLAAGDLDGLRALGAPLGELAEDLARVHTTKHRGADR